MPAIPGGWGSVGPGQIMKSCIHLSVLRASAAQTRCKEPSLLRRNQVTVSSSSTCARRSERTRSVPPAMSSRERRRSRPPNRSPDGSGYLRHNASAVRDDPPLRGRLLRPGGGRKARHMAEVGPHFLSSHRYGLPSRPSPENSPKCGNLSPLYDRATGFFPPFCSVLCAATGPQHAPSPGPRVIRRSSCLASLRNGA